MVFSVSGDFNFLTSRFCIQGNIDANLPEPFLKGLSTARLNGRAQTVYDSSSTFNSSETKENAIGDLIFYLDGAHSPESMEVCARWFSSVVKEDRSFSSKDELIQEATENGVIRHERESSEGSSKISKQVSNIRKYTPKHFNRFVWFHFCKS